MPKEIIRGYVYGIFPADCTKERIFIIDCWFNRNFLWLLKLINSVLGIMCALTGFDNLWLVKFKKDDKKA